MSPAGKVTSLCECVVQVDNVRAAVDNDGGKFGFEPEFLQRIVVSAAATDLLPQSPQSTIRRPVRDRVRPLLVHRHHLPPVAPGGAGPLQGHGRWQREGGWRIISMCTVHLLHHTLPLARVLHLVLCSKQEVAVRAVCPHFAAALYFAYCLNQDSVALELVVASPMRPVCRNLNGSTARAMEAFEWRPHQILNGALIKSSHSTTHLSKHSHIRVHSPIHLTLEYIMQ